MNTMPRRQRESTAGKPERVDVVWVALCAGAIAAAVLATVRVGWWSDPVWQYTPGLERFGWTLFALAVAVALPGRWLRRGAAMAGLLLALAANGAQALIGCLAVLVCAWICGDRALIWLRFEAAQGILRDLVALAAGLALLALAVNLAVFFPINTSPVYALAMSAVVVAGAGRLGRRLGQARLWIKYPTQLALPTSLLLRGVLVLCGLHIVVASFPELGHDALSMHLAIPRLVAAEGRWDFDVDRFVWAVMPMNANWLYAAAFLLGGEAAARLLNAASLLLVGAAVYSWGLARLGPTAALAAAAFWLSLPLSFLESNSAFVELPLTFLLAGALLAAEAAGRGDRTGAWGLTGLLFGSSIATKLPALLMAPGLALAVTAPLFGRMRAKSSIDFGRVGIGTIALVAATAVFACPPYLVAWIRTGNPVFPFFNQVFQSPFFDTTISFTNPLFIHPLDLQTLVDTTLRTTRFIESRHNGALGIAFLALLPLALAGAAARRQAWVWVLAAASLIFCLLVFREQVYLRYVAPVLPLLCLVTAYALTLPRSASATTVLTLICCGVALARLPVASYPLVWFPVQSLWSDSARDEFLRQVQPEQLAIEAVARLTAGTSDGLAIFDLTPAVARAPANVLSDSWHSNAFSAALRAKGVDALPQLLLARGVVWIVLPQQRDSPLLNRAREISSPVARIENVELRRLDASKISMPEMLRDPDLRQAVAEWSVSVSALDPDGRGVWATLSAPATQRVEVRPGARLRLEQDYTCPTPTEVRSQLNWHDARGKFIGASIHVEQCAGDVTVSSLVRAPPGASSAIVYGTPHTEERVLVRRMSLQLSAIPITGK